jgi:hypothetical protein
VSPVGVVVGFSCFVHCLLLILFIAFFPDTPVPPTE